MIPDGWSEVRLGDLGYTFGGLTGKSAKDFGVGGAIFVTFMNVMSNVVLSMEGVELVDVRQGETQNKLRARDVIFNGSSETPEEVGFGATVPDELDGVYLNSFCFGFRCHPDAQLDTEFFAYLTRSPIGRGVIRPMAQGSTRYNIAKTNLLNGRFLLPPLAEQQAIAEALSDADALVESLDALIAKKRDMKQAAMQQLLTGQTRLPGLPEKWTATCLGNVATLIAGINKPLTAMGRGTLYLTVQETYVGSRVDPDSLGRIDLTFDEIARFGLRAGDIVFGKSSVKREGIGYPNLFTGATEPVVHSGFTYAARPHPEVVIADFLFHSLRSHPTRKWLINNSQASALTNINAQIARAVPVMIPPLAEQRQIAEVLSDMDAEIDALVAQREKADLVKQGMMQELLSGRVRLV